MFTNEVPGSTARIAQTEKKTIRIWISHQKLLKVHN